MIKNYTEFLNENLRYGNAALGDDFIKNATAALTDAGFIVISNSTPRQLKNGNLACTISYPKMLDFLKEYYNLDKNVILAGDIALDDLFKRLKVKTIIYKRGAVIREGQSSDDFKFSSYNELVLNMKIFFCKEFIKGSTRSFDASVGLPVARAAYDAPWSVFPRMREVVDDYHKLQPPKTKLSDGAKKILDGYVRDFSKKYDRLALVCPAYVEKINSILSTYAEFIILNQHEFSKDDFFTPNELLYFQNTTNNFHFDIASMQRSVIKDKASMKVSYNLAVNAYRGQPATYKDELASIYEKLLKMTDAEREEYFENLHFKKRGIITGKKYGL
jgi:hypothetical protein